MPLADKTAVANLALDHLGEPYLTDYATDTGTTGEAVRLHMDQCVETVLEGHVWSFATRCATLVADPFASAILNGAGTHNSLVFTAVEAGPAGDLISVEIATAAAQATATAAVDELAITLTPGTKARMVVSGTLVPDITGGLIYAGVYNGYPSWTDNGLSFDDNQGVVEFEFVLWTSGQWRVGRMDAAGVSFLFLAIIASVASYPDGLSFTTSTGTGTATVAAATSTAIEGLAALAADEDAAALVTAANSGTDNGSGTLAAVAATFLSGGTLAPAYGSSFVLPTDCLRLLKIDGDDIDLPRNDFEIQGRHLLLEESEADAPVIHYILKDPPVDEWPTTFTDAVAFLLASRLAPKLAQDQALSATLLQKHELALGKARSKDARETRSKENAGPRQLAARSGLVRARYGPPRPPY